MWKETQAGVRDLKSNLLNNSLIEQWIVLKKL